MVLDPFRVDERELVKEEDFRGEVDVGDVERNGAEGKEVEGEGG